jgi:hypothetical protein
MSKTKNWVVGRWLIESMDQWDRDFIDEEVRGYFEFDARGSGFFSVRLCPGTDRLSPRRKSSLHRPSDPKPQWMLQK